MSSTQIQRAVRLRSPRGGSVTEHLVEVIDYHVSGWSRTRCLTHGIEEIATFHQDPADTAIAGAQECWRHRQLWPDRKPLQPALTYRDDGWELRDEGTV